VLDMIATLSVLTDLDRYLLTDFQFKRKNEKNSSGNRFAVTI
jgi:hypothetical protein